MFTSTSRNAVLKFERKRLPLNEGLHVVLPVKMASERLINRGASWETLYSKKRDLLLTNRNLRAIEMRIILIQLWFQVSEP